MIAFRVVLASAIVASPLPAAEKAKTQSPALSDVLTRFDAVQAKVRTLSADFTETTRSPLLKEPIVAKGRFFLTKPASVMWEYKSPEVMRFVLANDEYIGLFPERHRAERRDLKRWSEQIFRFFGLGQGSTELAKYYDLRLGDPSQNMKGAVQIVLEPKKRRLKKNVDQVTLWVDDVEFIPVKVEYVGKDGSSRSIRFQDTRLNPDIAAAVYHVDIPAEFTVTKGFSGLGFGGGDSR